MPKSGSSGDPQPRPRKSLPKAPKKSSSRPKKSPPQTPFERELTTKRRGELAELAFVYKAATLGFAVSKPYGDSQRYDAILDTAQRLLRVQVKCTTFFMDGFYHLNAHRRVNGRAIPYQLSEVDFLAAYIVPDDSFFILPLAHILGCTSLLFRPKTSRRKGTYDQYREAWHLLRAPDGFVIL